MNQDTDIIIFKYYKSWFLQNLIILSFLYGKLHKVIESNILLYFKFTSNWH